MERIFQFSKRPVKKFLLSSFKVHIIEGYTVAQDLTTALLQMPLIWILLINILQQFRAWHGLKFIFQFIIMLLVLLLSFTKSYAFIKLVLYCKVSHTCKLKFSRSHIEKGTVRLILIIDFIESTIQNIIIITRKWHEKLLMRY